MLRGVAKAGVQLAFGRAPRGASAYRALTRGVLGTGASHITKLTRVWPGYVRAWRDAGLALDGARVWIHEAGPTPYSPLVAYLASGRGGVATVSDGRVRSRYLARAVNAALAVEVPGVAADVLRARRDRVEALRWARDARAAVAAIGGAIHEGIAPSRIPLADASIAVCHSGGALEHLRPDALRRFLGEMRRVLRPGGLACHVVDHRDHLYHADKRIPFLAHLAIPEAAYELAFGHALGYHNRLAPGAIAALFERAGFRRVAMRRLLLPDHRYASDAEVAARGAPGLPRRLLAARFRGISDLDLRTAATHFLYAR